MTPLPAPSIPLPSPKQSPAKDRRDWYPYYAGFTEAFAIAVLTSHLSDATTVLDPWSGSGTTTATCIKSGVQSVGLDLNPAMTVIATGRLAPFPQQPPLRTLADQILETARESTPGPDADDLLAHWVRPKTARRIRAIQSAIHSCLKSSQKTVTLHENISAVDQLPTTACFFYCILFSTVRSLLTRFGTTNPMWLKPPASYRHRIAPSWKTLKTTFSVEFRRLSHRLTFLTDPTLDNHLPFRTGNAATLPFANDHFDAALTSPPYATRLDYVKGTLPELAVLGATERTVRKLRREATGSPVVRGQTGGDGHHIESPYARRTLAHIKSHPSKGSQSYYLPWMRNYLHHLQAGILEIDRVVKAGGTVGIVVQDSYYKGFHVNLQRIVVETLASRGRTLSCRYDNPVHAPYRNTQRLNVRMGRKRSHTETVLVFS